MDHVNSHSIYANIQIYSSFTSSEEGIDGFMLKPIFNIHVEVCTSMLQALTQGKA